MSIMLRLTVDDRHGVLDRITGIIRRNGWNISSINAGEMKHGYSNINIRLEDRGADVKKLGKALSQLESVKSWEECSEDTHFIRELLIMKMYEEDYSKELLGESRIIKKIDNVMFVEFTGLPWEIDELLKKLQDRVLNCARAGVLSIIEEGGGINEQ